MINTKLNLLCAFSKMKVELIHTLFSNWLCQINNEVYFRLQIVNWTNNHKTFQIAFS